MDATKYCTFLGLVSVLRNTCTFLFHFAEVLVTLCICHQEKPDFIIMNIL